MGKQTIYTVPEGIEVEKFEFDGTNAVITFKDKDVFVPKDGDVCVGHNYLGDVWIYIFESKITIYDDKFHVLLVEGGLKFNDWCDASIGNTLVRRKATPSEALELFSAMEKAGYKWNAEEKKVEKIRWRAKKGESYWCSSLDANDGNTLYEPFEETEAGDKFDDAMFKQGDYHKTKAESQAYCDKLNEAIKNLNQWK